MQQAFGIVLLVVAVVGIVVALITVVGSGNTYRQIGSGGFSLDESPAPTRVEPTPGSPAALTERDDEIRQMLQARNARRQRRGEQPLDIDAEISRMTAPVAPAQDAGLREEVRQLVIARNERRKRKGQEPLDVEAEVDRQLEEFS
jgi:hypothetical protein